MNDTSAALMNQNPSAKPTSQTGVDARHRRDLRDIRMLKVRVRDATQLAGDIIGCGCGCRMIADELETALSNPLFAFSARERRDARKEIEGCAIREAACRVELSRIPAWADLADRSTWRELGRVAELRDHGAPTFAGEAVTVEDRRQLTELRALKLQLAQPELYTPEAIAECREILRETAGMYRSARQALEARLTDPRFAEAKERNTETINFFRVLEAEYSTESVSSVN